MDIIFCAAARMLPDLFSSSDSSSQEGAYLNEMEGPSLPGANSVRRPRVTIYVGDSVWGTPSWEEVRKDSCDRRVE